MEQHAGTASTFGHRAVSDPQSLILMFSPPIPPVRVDPNLSPGDRRALWAADAVHRANNLAQLAAALAHVRLQTFDAFQLKEMGRNAQTLAAAYAELAGDRADASPVPCAELLTAIVRGLIDIFGTGRAVVLSSAIAELSLAPERRRALALIASELVVNALKYAFPEQGGTIAVSLGVEPRHALLVVADDGVGLPVTAKPGTGSRILDELAVLLHAPVERAEVPGGGLRVSVRLPLIHSE